MAPTFVAATAEAHFTPVATGTFTVTSPAFTPAVGELLVVKAGARSHTITGVSDSQGLTWTQRATVTNVDASSRIWTAPVVSAVSTTVTATFNAPSISTAYRADVIVERYSNAQVGTGVSQVAASSNTATITPSAGTSLITWGDTDRSGATGTPTAAAGSLTGFSQSSGAAAFYFGYQASTGTTSQTYGVTSPTSTTSALVAIEIIVPPFTTYQGAATLSAVSSESFAWHDFNPSGNATLSATSAVAASASGTFGATAALSATSGQTLGPVAVRVASATLSATSSQSFDASWPIAPGAAVLSAVSAMTEGPWVTELAVSTLSATSQMVASPDAVTPLFIPPPGPVVPQVPTPELRLLVAETRTGRVLFELPMSSLQWDSPIGPSTGTLTADIPIEHALQTVYGAGYANPRQVLSAFVPGAWRFSLALAYGSSVMWAGPYMPSQNPPDKQSMSIAAVEFPKMFDKRLLYNPAGTATKWTDPSYDLSFNGVTPQWLIYQLVATACTSTPFSPNRELPVYCSNVPDQAGLSSVTYHAYDTRTVLAALADVITLPNGPDVRFLPFLSEQSDGEHLAYDLQIGDPYLDRNPIWTWDDSLTLIQRDTDASSMATGVWVPGNGQDEDKVVGWQTLPAGSPLEPNISFYGWPALEQVDGNHASIDDQNLLAAYAAADLAAGATVVDSWTLKVPIDGDPPAGAYRPGDLAQIEIREHPLIPPGTYRRRITDCSGDLTQQVQVICSDLDAVQFSAGS